MLYTPFNRTFPKLDQTSSTVLLHAKQDGDGEQTKKGAGKYFKVIGLLTLLQINHTSTPNKNEDPQVMMSCSYHNNFFFSFLVKNRQFISNIHKYN